MRLTKVGGECDEGTCPAIFKTDRGTYVVQGSKVVEEHGLEIPDHETIAEIPEELLRQVARDLA
ncbi:hypothetical protein [Streptosporangium sp. NPDC002524]|uniref:hypothetical protein n=1 Tax=Streptosporangium sp. NPDC002524 TaxID=3154537 RepID=UPI00331D1BC4